MKSISIPSGVLGVVLAGLLGLSGCGTAPPPDTLAEAVRMGERPVAMHGLARVPQLEPGVKIVSEESGFSRGTVYEGSRFFGAM